MSLLLLFGGATTGSPPANDPPTANAGPNGASTTGSGYTLAGSATDDGLPLGILTTLWTKFSGPGIVTFIDATDPLTSVSVDTAGVYVLRLTADDTALTHSDDMTLTVTDPPTGGSGGWGDPWFDFIWH